jgi:hypothetical protein
MRLYNRLWLIILIGVILCIPHIFALGVDIPIPVSSGAGTGNCPSGQVVQNITGGGPQCVSSSGGSQTPWTSNINGAGFSLANVGFLEVNGSTSGGGRSVFQLGNSSSNNNAQFVFTNTANGLLNILTNKSDSLSEIDK